MKKLVMKLLTALLFALFFLVSTGPIREGDIFWHIRTGEWIWQHKAVPSEDPFTFTAQSKDPARPHSVRYNMILKGYWLSQPVFYFLYRFFGISGLVLFRAVVIALILFILYAWMRSLGVRYSLSLAALSLVGFFIKDTGDRPQYFSFLFFPVIAILLELLRKKLREDGSRTRTPQVAVACFLLPFVMLLWANMHGGYVMGVLLICLYLAGGLFRFGDGSWKIAFNPKFSALLVFSILVTFLNPNTYRVFEGLWYEVRGGVQFAFVAEMMSPFRAAVLYGSYNISYWIVLMAAVFILLFRAKGMRPERALSLLAFGAASLSAQRMIPFFLALTPVIASEIEKRSKQGFKKIADGMAVVPVVLVFVMGFQLREGLFDYSLDSQFPVEAANFLNLEKPRGKLFNYADWGGYLMVYAPEFKVFDDGRRLMDDVEIAQNSVMTGSKRPLMGRPEWEAYLEAYNIEIILVPAVTPFMDDFVPLVERLYRDDDWVLVYRDNLSLIYLKKGGQNEEIVKRLYLPKELALINAINRLHSYRTETERRGKVQLIADLYSLMGRDEAAKEYYKLLEK